MALAEAKSVSLFFWQYRMLCPTGGLVFDRIGGTLPCATAALQNVSLWSRIRDGSTRLSEDSFMCARLLMGLLLQAWVALSGRVLTVSWRIYPNCGYELDIDEDMEVFKEDVNDKNETTSSDGEDTDDAVRGEVQSSSYVSPLMQNLSTRGSVRTKRGGD